MRKMQNMTTSYVLAWLKLNGFLALAGILGPVLMIVSQVVAIGSTENYSLVRDSISSLAWTKMGWFQDTSFLMTGLLLEGFTVALLLGIQRARGFTLGITLLAFSGFGLICVGAFRTDLAIPTLPGTMEGTIHGIAAQSVFLSLPLARLFMAPSLKKDPHWRPLFIFSIATAAFTLIWIAVYRLCLPDELSWFGLFERILAANEFIWITITAIWLLRLPGKLVQETRTDYDLPLVEEGELVEEQES